MTSFLTIDDYFNQAGARVHNNRSRRVTPSKAGASGENFAHLLKGLSSGQKATAAPTRHFELSDYRRLAISARPTVVRYSAQASQLKPQTTPELHKKIGRDGPSNYVQPPPDEGEIGEKTDIKILPKAKTPGMLDQTVSDRQKIDDVIDIAARKYNLKPALIRAVIKAESDFNADVVSRAGAQGLMQLMPETAKDLGVSNPFDIEQNIHGGVRYLRQMMDRFNGNLRLALAAYNAGPGAVQRYQGIPPYEETIEYVQKVLAFSRQKV